MPHRWVLGNRNLRRILKAAAQPPQRVKLGVSPKFSARITGVSSAGQLTENTSSPSSSAGIKAGTTARIKFRLTVVDPYRATPHRATPHAGNTHQREWTPDSGFSRRDQALNTGH
jgi:hypothetical protein